MREGERPYFSIVMPVYNGEKFIKKMIKSIIEQTFTDWELIVVDDCSTDESAPLVKALSAEDERIRLVTLEKNGGVSEGRNRGISEARGRYLWFADADDRVDPDLLLKVKESIEVNPAKLVIFGLIEEYYDAQDQFQYSHRICHEEKYFRTKGELRPEMIILERETLYGYPWNKVYDLEYLKKGAFQFSDYNDAKFIEDIKFNVEFCMEIDSLNILSFCPYHYAKRMQSNLTNEFTPDYFKFHRKRIKMLFDQYAHWGICTGEVKAVLGSLYARYILSAMQRNCDKRSGMGHDAREKWCKKLFDDRLFNELIDEAEAEDSRALSVLITVLRKRNAFLCLAMGRAVYGIKNMMPMVYSKVKSRR